MRKVLIPTKLDKKAADILSDRGYQVVLDSQTPMEELIRSNPDAEVLIVRSEKVTPEVIDALPQLKLIVRAGAGFNTIDIKYARKHDIDVMNTPGANSNAVAEEVIALILSAYRHVVPADISTRAGLWEKSKFMGRELTGKTIGVIGLGHIGQLVVKRLAGFEVKVLGFDPFLAPAMAEKLGVKLCSVEDIFANADCVTLHIPENDETRGMFNRRLFDLMKPGAMLINCARCGIINEEDLRLAKAEKKIIFCNDVYPKDIAGDKSVKDIADIMLPHLGANTFEANFTAACRAAEQTIDYFEKGITSAVVNKALPDGLDAKYEKLAFVITKLCKAYVGEENLCRIETSFYGELAKYGAWLTAAIAAGLSPDFTDQGPKDVAKSLTEAGIELLNRDVDNNKKYGESMTIDLFAGKDPIRTASVRGTLTENHLMISRIGNYDGLYLDPSGNHLFVEYQDAPGIVGKIAGILGEKNINIIDIRAPQDTESGRSLTVIKTNMAIPELIVDKIRESVDAVRAFQFDCGL